MALIRREDVWALVGDDVMTVRPGSKLEAVINRYANAIDNAPEVDAEPVVHAHWIYGKHGWAECSACHHDFLGVYDLENSDNYCRHCGAKMDGGDGDVDNGNNGNNRPDNRSGN